MAKTGMLMEDLARVAGSTTDYVPPISKERFVMPGPQFAAAEPSLRTVLTAHERLLKQGKLRFIGLRQWSEKLDDTDQRVLDLKRRVFQRVKGSNPE